MNQNGTAKAESLEITNEHLQELFRRLPAAGEVMRTILLESENATLRERLAALEAVPAEEVVSE